MPVAATMDMKGQLLKQTHPRSYKPRAPTAPYRASISFASAKPTTHARTNTHSTQKEPEKKLEYCLHNSRPLNDRATVSLGQRQPGEAPALGRNGRVGPGRHAGCRYKVGSGLLQGRLKV